mmetsp:Transcript_26259/g.60627  ORF Transcript_26259/g.60627 Transcript_26259/m.60627 type:complete len:224 (-) Transcript_26259:324-995(-)
MAPSMNTSPDLRSSSITNLAAPSISAIRPRSPTASVVPAARNVPPMSAALYPFSTDMHEFSAACPACAPHRALFACTMLSLTPTLRMMSVASPMPYPTVNIAENAERPISCAACVRGPDSDCSHFLYALVVATLSEAYVMPRAATFAIPPKMSRVKSRTRSLPSSATSNVFFTIGLNSVAFLAGPAHEEKALVPFNTFPDTQVVPPLIPFATLWEPASIRVAI